MTGKNPLRPITGQSAAQIRNKVHSRLRKAIIEGGFRPGDRLIERKLAAQLKVSRTPVREAIRVLEREGLVSHIPRVGAAVAKVDPGDVLDVYRIRAVLEGLAARLAAERIKGEQLENLTRLLAAVNRHARAGNHDQMENAHRAFNDVLYRAAGSPRLYSMITTLVDYIGVHVRVGYSRPGRIEEAAGEHHRLVQALKMRDGDLAESVAREHIENSRRAYFRGASEQTRPGGGPGTGEEGRPWT